MNHYRRNAAVLGPADFSTLKESDIMDWIEINNYFLQLKEMIDEILLLEELLK